MSYDQVRYFLFLQEIHGEYKGVNQTAYICWVWVDEITVFDGIYFGLQTTILVANITAVLVLYVMIGLAIYRRQRAMEFSASSLPVNETAEIQDTEPEEIETKINLATRRCASATQPTSRTTITRRASTKSKASSPSTKFTTMFITISVVYVLSYIPTCVMIISVFNLSPATWRELPVWQQQLYSILAESYIINNIVNPLIYGYFDVKFRKYVAVHGARLCFCCRKV